MFASVTSWLPAAVAAAVLAGCVPGDICGYESRVLEGATCSLSEDCPQTGAVTVCLYDSHNDRACVLCADVADAGVRSQCVELTPVRCP